VNVRKSPKPPQASHPPSSSAPSYAAAGVDLDRDEAFVEQIREKGMRPENLEWFTKFFRYGVPPHGGFCIGIERLTMQLLDLKNIREAALFPRAPERLLP